jgi:hypothetical protein
MPEVSLLGKARSMVRRDSAVRYTTHLLRHIVHVSEFAVARTVSAFRTAG